MLRGAGVADPSRVLGPLLTAALDNGLRRGDKGLTGPVSRGDVGTVADHLQTLTERAPASVAAYVAMAQRTTERALSSGRLKRHEGAPLLDLLYDARATRRVRGDHDDPPRRRRDRRRAAPAPRRAARSGGAGADHGRAARGPPQPGPGRSRAGRERRRLGVRQPDPVRARRGLRPLPPHLGRRPRGPRRGGRRPGVPPGRRGRLPGRRARRDRRPRPARQRARGRGPARSLRRRADRRRQAVRPRPSRPRRLRREGLPAAHAHPGDGARARRSASRWSACRPSARTTAWRCPPATGT